MKIVLDTNIVLDLWRMKEENFSSYCATDTALYRKDKICITAAQLPTIAYLFEALKLVEKSNIDEAMQNVFDYCEIIDSNELDGLAALKDYAGDYEDDMIMNCAFRHNADLILTRNIKDFKDSPVPAMTPDTYTEVYKPANLIYNVYDIKNKSIKQTL